MGKTRKAEAIGRGKSLKQIAKLANLWAQEEDQESVSSEIQLVRLLPLQGTLIQRNSAGELTHFIDNCDKGKSPHPGAQYEVEIRYTNGSTIQGQFPDKEEAVRFLRSRVPLSYHPFVAKIKG